MRIRRWRRALYGFLIWTGLGLFAASQYYLTDASRGRPIDWNRPLLPSLSRWYLWGLLALFIVAWARRAPLNRERWKRSLAVHLPMSALVSGIHTTAFVGIIWGLNPDIQSDYSFVQLWGLNVGTNFHLGVLTYWAIPAITLATDYYRKYRERELQAAQLETERNRAQLQALRTQLQPHFLFNTLNAIGTLLHRDPDGAERMLARLGELLRLTIDHSGEQHVPLRQELEHVERYLEIEQIRFGDRLSVAWDVDPKLLDAPVPYLMLQPLVENAVRHGIAPRTAPGRIEVSATQEDGQVVLNVRDNGPGLDRTLDESTITGVGLANTQRRLATLYPNEHQFEWHNRANGGFQTTIRLPIQPGAQPETQAHPNTLNRESAL